MTFRFAIFVLAPLIALQTLGYTFADSDNSTASSLLEQCVQMQSRTDHVTIRGTSEGGFYKDDGDVPKNRTEFYFCRDGLRLDCTDRQTIQLLKPNGMQIRQGRTVCNEIYYVVYGFDVGRQIAPTRGIYSHAALDLNRAEALNRKSNWSAPLDGYLGSSGDKRVAELMLQGKNLNIKGEENLDGVSCKIVEARTSYGSMKLWLAPSQGYLPLRAEVHIGPDDRLWNGQKAAEAVPTELQPQVWQEATIVVDRVKVMKIGDAWVPISGRVKHTTIFTGGSKLNTQYTFERAEVKLDPDFTDPTVFKTDLPDGSTIENLDDLGSGTKYLWQSGHIVAVAKQSNK